MKRTLGTILSVMLLSGLLWGAATIPLARHVTGNPRRDEVTTMQTAEKREVLASDQRSKREWLQRIEKGYSSFAEGACVYEEHGWWNEATSRCDLSFPPPVKQGS
jgi:hypothetical protein